MIALGPVSVVGILPLVALGGYQAVEMVDSSAFCVQVCHQVHLAEATTYKESPHSEVPCSSCHVGIGTENLVRSKMVGLKEIIPTLTRNYERPIPTPLSDRRPASETCETCHTSGKFLGDIPKVTKSFNDDEANSSEIVTRVLKVGGGRAEVASGIHWHSTARVWYVAVDSKRLKMAWVATEDESGNLTEYIDPSRIGELTPEGIQADMRLMDCVDCHNRVAHIIRSPEELVNDALANGSIDASLPFIKRQGLNAITGGVKSIEVANRSIEKIGDYYRISYPQVAAEKASSINSSIRKLKEIAKLVILPDGLDWNTYPDHSTHDLPDKEMNVDLRAIGAADNSSGCFRCHGNLVKVEDVAAAKMVRTAGTVSQAQVVSRVFTDSGKYDRSLPTGDYIGAECKSCHYTRDSMSDSPLAPAVSHPVDGLDNCISCHGPAAAKPLKASHPWTSNEACGGCHQSAPRLKSTSISPGDAMEIPHGTDKLENCLACHGTSGAVPVSKAHPWSTNETCQVCHSLAASIKPVSVKPQVKARPISHPTSKSEDCLVCHSPSSVRPLPAAHPWSTNETCVACHESAPGMVFKTPSALPVGPKITHSVSGLDNCMWCHGPNGLRPYPETHLGRPESFCIICHAPAARSPMTPLPPPPQAPAVRHSIAGISECSLCHQPNGPGPFPLSHDGRSNIPCLLCHKPAVVTVPAAPGGLTAAAVSATQVNLSWTDNASNETGYRVERATNNTFSAGLVMVNLAANAASHSDTTVSGGTAYYYRVYAYNTAGDSAASNTATVTTPVSTVAKPAAPGGLTAAAVSATQVNLSWTDNASNETGYRVERATDNTFSAGLVMVNLAANAASHSDTTVSGGTAYYYRVYAYNGGGDSTVSNTAAVSTPAVVIDSAALYTTYCASCHGANRQGTAAGPSVTTAALSGRTLASVTTAIANGVGSMPGYGTVMTSAQVSALAQYLKGGAVVTVPAAPGGLTAAAVSATQVNLTWTDNASNETGYRVERATNNTFSAGLVMVNLAANAASHSDTTVSGGTAYYYRVYAYNTAGDSAASNTATVTTPVSTVAKPAAPGGLTAAAVSATQVNLTWTDNASNETGYRVERATNNTFSAGLVMVNLAANATSHSDTTVSGGTAYYYRVYAYNGGGDSTVSNTAAVSTPAVVIDSAALYTTYCASCHGANRQGTAAGPSVTMSKMSGKSLSGLVKIINSGAGKMPGYSSLMTAVQINALAQYLRTTPP